MNGVKRRVARGVKLLDQRAPGWDQRIRLHHLDMSCGNKCVLGQLYGDYSRGLAAVFGDEPGVYFRTGYHYGFNKYWLTNFAELNQEWSRVIRERRIKDRERRMKDIIDDPAMKKFVDAIREDRLRLKVPVDA